MFSREGGGGIERISVRFTAEHKVCLWWGQLVTAERSKSVHLDQPLLHILTEKADSCIHTPCEMIHSSLACICVHVLHKHIWTPSRSCRVSTQSPFLLCWKAGKTTVRHSVFSAHVERLMGDYRSVAKARAEQGPSCWTGSHLRHSPAFPATLLTAWWAVSWGRKVQTDMDTTKSLDSIKMPVCSDYVNLKEAENGRVKHGKERKCSRLIKNIFHVE